MKRRLQFAAASLCAIAAAQYFWGASLLEKLPADFVSETRFQASCVFFPRPGAPAEAFDAIVRRRDQTLSSDATHSIIQGDTHWLTPEGVVVFETLNLYGVDRRTRENLPAYGNEKRSGQYLFPPDGSRKRFDIWDPFYAGPRVVTFDHAEQFGGLAVDVFNFSADGIDETSGYTALPDVPERYRATTYGSGKLWVEPVSGVVVDVTDRGISYYVDPTTGNHVAEIYHWQDRYTPDTVAAQLHLARQTRLRYVALEIWLPLALLAAAVACLIAARWPGRRNSGRPAAAVEALVG